MTPYSRLMEKYREISLVSSSMRLMEWDLETHMPTLGIQLRSDQLGVLKRVNHRMMVSDDIGALLKDAESKGKSMNDIQRRNIFLLKRERDIETSVPEDLVADIASQTAVARTAWLKAKTAHKWKMFEPELRKLIDLSVKRAEATMEARGVSTIYDAMIDDADRGLSQKMVGRLLTQLRDSLAPIVKKYQNSSLSVDSSFLHRKIPFEVQREVVKDSTTLIGYDSSSEKAWGAIDHTEHPFTTGFFDDVRITVHYTEDELFDPLFGGLHEAGHALYEHNINHDWMYQPIGQAVSGGMHEAMSRFAENIIGRSRHFWTYYYPMLNSLTRGAFSDISLDDLLRAVNKVEASKIRVKADEVTYSLHIVIRSEIERGLFDGKIEIPELPQVWNQLYDKYLGIEIDNDSEGVLQDVHWSVGLYGIFQSYALGNIYDGMFLKAMDKKLRGWTNDVEIGRPTVAINWLKHNVQRWGSMYDIDDLLKKATGSSMTAEPYVQYLKKRYSDLMG